MKTTIFSLLFLISISSFSQKEKLDQYTATNGITYKVGDTLKLSGSNISEYYKSFFTGGFGGWYNGRKGHESIKKTQQTLVFIINKIKIKEDKFNGNPYLIGKLTTTKNNAVYNLDIETAINNHEILTTETESEITETLTDAKYKKLLKLKELLDQGILTEDEFNEEKTKVLNN